MKAQQIKVIRIHPLGTMNVYQISQQSIHILIKAKIVRLIVV